MAFRRNSKTPTGILVVIGLVLLSMLFTFNISCQRQASLEEETETEEEPMLDSTEVEISGFAFVPATVTVSAESTVTWINQDSVPHTVGSESDLFDTSSGLSIRDSFSYTFTDRGTFSYYCTIHPYMKGEVVVE